MVYVLIAVALLALSQALTLGLGLLVLRAWARGQKRQLEAQLHSWLEPQGQDRDKPSKLAEALATGGEIIGAAAARSIMASLNADKSHVARVANGLSDELQGQQNPILGLLAGGKRGKGAAIARLGQMLLPMLGGGLGQGPNTQHGDSGDDVAGRIGKYG